MPDKIITALFDSRGDAESALRRLSQAGVGGGRVQISSEAGESGVASGSLGATGNLATVLGDQTLPAEDRETFAEGLRRGAYLLTARVTDAAAPQVVGILDETNAVDLDDRAQQWRSSGWAGPQVVSDTAEARNDGLSRGAAGDVSQRFGQAESGSQGQTIPVVAEELKVGKREIERGGVKVRSFLVETPVREEISLRQEHLSIERRAVDQPIRVGEDMMQERTVEFIETAEEVVVAKEARVVEEIVVRKDVEQRTEIIEDTVRHTDVEIEDSRGKTRT